MRRILFAGLLLPLVAWGCASAARQVKELEERAAAGDTDATVALGHSYAEGKGVQKDPVRAAELYRRAADTGNTDGELALGMLHQEGIGVAQDDQEALRWIRLAAESGNPRAQYLLGLMYADGSGVPKDQVEAHAWLNLAAAGLIDEERRTAVRQRDWLSEVMTPPQVAAAQKRARELSKKMGK